MKTIVSVNISIPTIEDEIDYLSGISLLDYDIVLFNPELPSEDRITFSGGGSCISIEGTKRIETAKNHWSKEILQGLKAGKIIFFILNEYTEDKAAKDVTMGTRGVQNYSTVWINNYDILPSKIAVRNAKGKHLKVIDSQFKGLHESLKNIAEYKVVFTSDVTKKIFITKDGSSVVSGIVKFKDISGSIVFLPSFDFLDMTMYDKDNGECWTDEAIRTSKMLVGQIIEIEKSLQSLGMETPKPDWIESINIPKKITNINAAIKKYGEEIDGLKKHQETEILAKEELLSYSALLYENGKALETAIEKSLILFGYTVENFREGDLEIDHIITHPNGTRLIGESEGKDNAAIEISKFRQLETNINEDFGRDEVIIPAKGVLFGNGYRLIEPSKRKEQFTQKCLTNAQRLGTALVQTVDLYGAVLYLLDNPTDEKYKVACRKAIETTKGEIVNFPEPKLKK